MKNRFASVYQPNTAGCEVVSCSHHFQVSRGNRFLNDRFEPFERFAIQVLLATQNVKGAMSILRTKWDPTWSIVERAVARGKARKEINMMPRLRIDEKAFLMH